MKTAAKAASDGMTLVVNSIAWRSEAKGAIAVPQRMPPRKERITAP